MVLYRIITVGSTKFDRFQHCFFLLVVKVKNYISTTSTFTSYKSERFSKQKRLFSIAVQSQKFCWHPSYIKMSYIKYHPKRQCMLYPINKNTFNIAEVIESAKQTLSQKILRLQAQNLAMKPKVCWRPSYLRKVIYIYHRKRKYTL